MPQRFASELINRNFCFFFFFFFVFEKQKSRNFFWENSDGLEKERVIVME